MINVIEHLDLSALTRQYGGRGSAAHHLAVLLGLLIYGNASGVHSSRKIERATDDSVAFRFVAANTHPNTMTGWPRFGGGSSRKWGSVRAGARDEAAQHGHIAVDGTKIEANARKHKALSWVHANKIEAQLRQEVQALAESSDTQAFQSPRDSSLIPSRPPNDAGALKT